MNGRWAREGLTVFTKVRDQVLGTLFLASKCHALSPATNDLPFFGPMKRGRVRRTRIAINTAGEQSWKQSKSRSCFIFNHQGLGVFCFQKKKVKCELGECKFAFKNICNVVHPLNDKNDVLPQWQCEPGD